MRHIVTGISFALLVAVAGCTGNNSSCTVGDLICNEDGDLTRCEGPSTGGDADGELIVIEDCGDQEMCWSDFGMDEFSPDGGCVSMACWEVHSIGSCFEDGNTACTLDNVFVCSADENGCLNWGFQEGGNCSEMGAACEDDGTVAMCVGGP